MGRRRAQGPVRPAEVAEVIPVSARVAWCYLAALLAGVGAALLVLVSDRTLAVVACASASGTDDATASCQFGYAIWVGLAGFLVWLLPAVLALRLGWGTWLALASAGAFLVAADSVAEWWWWLAAALVPAAAAMAGADWGRGEAFARGQRLGLTGLAVVAAATLAWWYLTG